MPLDVALREVAGLSCTLGVMTKAYLDDNEVPFDGEYLLQMYRGTSGRPLHAALQSKAALFRLLDAAQPKPDDVGLTGRIFFRNVGRHHGAAAAMTSDDDHLRCTEIAVGTQAHLCEQGFDFRYPFAVCIIRADGEHVDIFCDAMENVAALVCTLRPPRLQLSVGKDENHAAMLAKVRALLHDGETLH